MKYYVSLVKLYILLFVACFGWIFLPIVMHNFSAVDFGAVSMVIVIAILIPIAVEKIK